MRARRAGPTAGEFALTRADASPGAHADLIATLHRLAIEEQATASPVHTGPEIEPTREAAGAHLAQLMAKINDGSLGLAYPAMNQGGSANPEYWTVVGLSFQLRPGKSASQGIRAFLAGPTTCDCTTAIVALELDTLRALVGDELFDAQFGAEGETDRYDDNYLSIDNEPSAIPPSASAPANVSVEEIEAAMFLADQAEANGLRIDLDKARRLRSGETSGVRRKPRTSPEQLEKFKAILGH